MSHKLSALLDTLIIMRQLLDRVLPCTNMVGQQELDRQFS